MFSLIAACGRPGVFPSETYPQITAFHWRFLIQTSSFAQMAGSRRPSIDGFFKETVLAKKMLSVFFSKLFRVLSRVKSESVRMRRSPLISTPAN